MSEEDSGVTDSTDSIETGTVVLRSLEDIEIVVAPATQSVVVQNPVPPPPTTDTHKSEDSDKETEVSESVDTSVMGRGFGSDVEDEVSPRRPAFDDAQDEDWADQELRELRQHVAELPKTDRRMTINGVDIAPRSELSPPIQNPQDAPVVHEFEPSTKQRGKRSNKKGDSLTSGTADAFFHPNQPERRGTLARISSRLRRRKQQATASEIMDRHSKANHNVGGGTVGGVGGSSDGISLTGSTSKDLKLSLELESLMLNPEDLFRRMLDRALDDEVALQYFVFTMAYFMDPVRVLSDLITEHDVAVAVKQAEISGGKAEREEDEVVIPAAERAMKVISVWISHLWYQFEGSESLMGLLMQFVKSLQGTRWGQRLSDIIDTLVESRNVLNRSLESILAHGKGAFSKEDLFSEFDPDVDDDPLNQQNDDSEEEDEEDVHGDIAPKEDVKSTFVGAETYTDKSRPMGLADLMGEPKVDSDEEDDVVITMPRESKEQVASTLVGADKYNPASRPMGLMGLIGSGELPELSFRDEQGPGKCRASDLAKQLTLIEFTHWKLVSPLELQHATWRNAEEQKATYIKQMVSWHNRIAAWVHHEILAPGLLQTDRLVAMKRFLRIALCLERLQNYQTLFAIMAGLKTGAVARLRLETELPRAWKAHFEYLVRLTDPVDDWKSYRAVLNSASRFPFFPFVGVYLHDLQVLESRDKSFVPSADDPTKLLVNFPKMRRIGNLLKEMVYIQRGSEYRFKQSSRVLSYLLSLKQVGEEELWQMSHDVKPSVISESDSDQRIPPQAFLAAAISPRLAPSPPETSRMEAAARHTIGRSKSENPSPMHSPRKGSGASPSYGLSPRGHVSPNMLMLCPLCSIPFSSKKGLADHLINRQCTGSSLRQHTCPVCEESFVSKVDLVSHLQARSCTPPSGGPPVCPVCNAKFGKPADLRAHLHKKTCLGN